MKFSSGFRRVLIATAAVAASTSIAGCGGSSHHGPTLSAERAALVAACEQAPVILNQVAGVGQQLASGKLVGAPALTTLKHAQQAIAGIPNPKASQTIASDLKGLTATLVALQGDINSGNDVTKNATAVVTSTNHIMGLCTAAQAGIKK